MRSVLRPLPLMRLLLSSKQLAGSLGAVGLVVAVAAGALDHPPVAAARAQALCPPDVVAPDYCSNPGPAPAVQATRCPSPAGSLDGERLGALALGITRAQARETITKFVVTRNGFDDFCQYRGWWIRAAYPNSTLLGLVSPAERSQTVGRVVILLTANQYYSLDGVHPRTPLTPQIVRRLHLEAPERVGGNVWYVSPGAVANGVLKVQDGLILEIGTAERQMTSTSSKQFMFFGHLNAAG